MIIMLAILLEFFSLGFTKETDQFTDRFENMQMLKDSTPILDKWFNQRLLAAQKKFKPQMTEGEKFEIVQKQYVGQMSPAFQTPIYSWMELSINRFKIAEYKPKNRGIYQDTNLKDVGWVGVLGITPTIKVNSVLIGKDKLGHFICQGLQYYREYVRQIKNGATDEEAKQKVLELGHELEMTSQGLTTDGVYSVADLAANWQGFTFWKNLFSGDNSYFLLIDGQHRLTRKFSLKDYVTHDFDEALNPSFFNKKSTFLKVTKNIQDYCQLTQNRLDQFDHSSRWLSQNYLVSDFGQNLWRPNFDCILK